MLHNMVIKTFWLAGQIMRWLRPLRRYTTLGEECFGVLLFICILLQLNKRNPSIICMTCIADSRFKSQSRESLNSFVPDPDKPKDLRTMTNVKVIAIQSYSAQVSHELSFKKGKTIGRLCHTKQTYIYGTP